MILAQRPRCAAAALLIVLAFLVLLAGVTIAYLSRTATDRQIAQSSFNDAKADQLARSALDVVVGDFKQEIAAGSASSAGSYPYTPSTNANVVPQHSPSPAAGATPAIPNLIRRSIRSDAVPAPGVPSRASAVNSVNDRSMNGRFVTFARWNSHYLVPKLNTGDDSTDPILGAPDFSSPNYWAPDWVLVTSGGPKVFNTWDATARDTTNNNYVIGRYAYAVYDEGGLLDMNVVGYPYPTSPPSPYTTDVGRKGNSAFADLTALRTTATGFVSTTVVNRIVGWRNYATVQETGVFPTGITFSSTGISNFVTYFLDRARDFRATASTTFNNRTDQAFLTRSELIKLRSDTLAGSANMLQYLGTFSRETNHSTWSTSPTVLAGRFPLSRFDLFATIPPSGSAAADIQKYFGLLYVAATSSPSVVQEHWQYVGTSGSSLLSAIPSISGANQNPDLFPLFRYLLPGASIGEILSIGASLIDQHDSDTNTTWIEYGSPSGTQKAFGVDQTPPTDPTAPPAPSNPTILKRSFRNVGELGYAYRNSSTTLDFQSASSSDAPMLDFFTYNVATSRAGVVNLNTRNAGVLAAIIQRAITSEASTTYVGQADPGSNPSKTAYNAAIAIVTNTTNGTTAKPALGRADVTRLVANTGTILGSSDEAKEAAARALAEVGQTRTWGLLVDVIAQSGRYPPTAANLSQFVVESEKRYWLHIAIDRFTGEVIDQQLEEVFE
jgi:hypothetical protein